MAKAKPTQADRDHAYRMAILRWSQITRIAVTLAVCGAIVGALYVGVALPVQASAGQTTTVSYVLEWVQDWQVGTKLAWTGVAGSVVWAILERRMRMKERRAKDSRIVELEKRLDPNRTSSGLNVSGGKKA
jgi:hypothetical protein